MKKNFIFKRVLTLVLAVMMLVTAMPVGVLADPAATGNQSDGKFELKYDNGTIVRKEDYINETKNLPVVPKKTENAEEFVKNPDMPKLYTVHADFKVQRGDDLVVSYQPYIATAGDDEYEYTDQNGDKQKVLSYTEKNRINKRLTFPKLDGYTSATPNGGADITYDFIKGKALAHKNQVGAEYKGHYDYIYTPITSKLNVKHLFQDINDFDKYDKKLGEEDKDYKITTQQGVTGTSLTIQPLPYNEIIGYVPESTNITTQVPENPDNFVVELRYNLAHYNIKYDTTGGTEIPARTLYYGQVIPKIADADIPTKVGGEFLGWKPSVELKTKDGKTFEANKIIAVGTGSAIKNLDNNLIMPPSDVTFTAVWKNKDKADYAVQFWAEKADHADGASLADKYEYMGTRVYKDQMTGMRPDLDNVPVKDIVFPDLDQKRLAKIWGNAQFNRGKDLYLNKFFVYNKALTDGQNADPKNTNLIKSVDSTGKTVYNIYYDRQVYDLYFTKSNALPAGNTFYPEIWGYDEAQGEIVKKGGPGNPYHYKARFNQLMLGWPNDAMQTKGFSEGMQSFGWGSNFSNPAWPTHLDTPPYRLNADQFLDMEGYDTRGGYTKKIDKGDGSSIDLKWFDYTILSFGIKQEKNSMPHHMDFWMDGFKPDETIIRYDLYRYKADTNSDTYAPKYPQVQGFTGKRANERPDYFDSDGIDEKNDERADVTPFPAKTYTDMYGERPVGMMKFIKAFLNNGDEWGDPDGWDGFDKNGYLKFEYSRNKYPLRFNYDPSKIKGDNEFNSTNQLDTFYEFPLKCLSPDVDTDEEYKKVAKGENPSNLLDNPENLQKLSLTDLVFNDKNDNNKLKVKRPDNLSDQMVFKGWALDPAGSKLIWENPGEKMPSHPVNLYAKWGEPDYKWKVTFDPDGGVLENINEEKLTQERKTIQEGDIGQIEVNTYAKKEANDGDKQVFTVIQRQKLVEPKKPTKRGYEFMGWEVIHYTKDADGNYTSVQDTSYRDTYKVPELYSFGNDVVSPVYLKAIWVESNLIDIKSYHHFLDKDYKELTEDDREIQTLRDRRVGSYLAAVGSRQNAERILVPKDEWEKLEKNNTTELDDSMTYAQYRALDKKNPRVNSYNQQIRIEQEKIQDPAHPNDPSKLIDNPINQFHFYYRPFRHREYKVNYLDERGRKEVEEFIVKSKEAFEAIKNNANLTDAQKDKEYKDLLKANRNAFEAIREKYAIIDQEAVKNGKRHFDARNYRPIAGWVLDDKPQQQLFFDINEDTNAFYGINETGFDEINFFYKDVRVVETNKNDPVPDGYVRVTFKAADGGSFGNDANGDPIKELYYDVVKGLRSQLLPVPQLLGEGETKAPDKYYITPDNGKNFTKWDKRELLNENTIIEQDYTFTAQYDWSDLKVSSKGLVSTESYIDPDDKWTNEFAPTIDELKNQLVLTKNNQVINNIDEHIVAQLFDEKGKELKTDEDVLKLLSEQNKSDTEELVRRVNIKAKVKFKDEKYKDLENAAEGLAGEIAKLKAEIEQNKKKITELNKKIADKEAEKENLNTGDPDYQAKFAALEQEIAAMRTEIENLKTQNNAKNEEINTKNNEIKTKTAEINKLKDELSKLKADEAAKQTEIASKEAGLKPLEKQLRELNEKILVDSAELNNLKAEGKLTANEIAKKEADIKTLKDQAKNIENQINSIKNELSTLKAEVAAKQEPIAKKEADISSKEKEIWNKADAIKAYEDGLTEQVLDIPVTIYKNVYEALTNGDMPKVLKDATAPGGDLANITGKYVKVTVQPTKEPTNKDAKIYYVNPYAWVKISEVDISQDASSLGFTKWTADKDEQNEKDKKGKSTGVFDFTKRHMFTEDTVITPDFSDDVVRQTDPNKKPDVPNDFVKVIVEKTEKAELKTGEEQTQTFWVNPNKEVTIPVAKPTGKTEAAAEGQQAKAYMFEKWTSEETPARTWEDKIVGKFEKETTITANYKQADNIISYDPEEPEKRPEGYVRVKFDADPGLKLTEQKAYYVKKNSGVKLSDLAHPKVDAKTGYEFNNKWDKADTIEIDQDLTVKALANKLGNVIPEKDGEGNPNTKPEGYKEVTFVIKTDDAAKGSITGVTKFYVNPTEYVTINPPATKANTGFEFGSWDKDSTRYTVYDKDTTITGSFNGLKDIIPKTKDDDSEKPAGYKTVTFVIDPEIGGQIVDKEVTVYYVNPAKDVTVPQPKTQAETGYEFDKWDQDTTTAKTYAADLTVKGNFKKLDDIIPSKDNNGNPNAQPEGYVTVTFTKGAHGSSISGETIFYVNPNANKTLANITPKPKVIPDTGYAVNGWDKIDGFTITKDTIVNAKFDDFDNVIPLINDQGGVNAIPFDYIKITFDTDGKGVIEGSTETTKVVFVKPNTAVALDGYAPKVKANDGYDFSSWDVDLTLPTVYNSPKIIKAIYNKDDDIKTTQQQGYVKVEFKTDPDKGTLQGDVNLWVRPNTQVTLPTPIVIAKPGHKFTGWAESLTVNLPKGSQTYVINAQYDNADNIIPKIDASGNTNAKPDGYVTVTFRADDNGKLGGDKKEIVYFVNPDAGVKLVDTVKDPNKEIAIPKVIADKNYELDKWYESIDKDNSITTDQEYVARFNKGKVTLTYEAGEGEGTLPIPVIVDYGTKVTLAPATNISKADASFEGWNLDIDGKLYKPGDEITLTKDTKAVAQWTKDEEIIKYDPKEPITKPDGYVRVTFEADNGLGLIEQKAYYVKKNAGVKFGDIKNDKTNYGYPSYKEETGYKFDTWDKADTDTITTDVLVTAKAEKLDKVIPEKDGEGNPNTKPEGYNVVTFVVKTEDKAKGSLEGVTKFYVNPTEYVTINPPTTEANTGFEFGAWDKDSTRYTVYDKDTTITGSFNDLKALVPKTKTDDSEKPKGYVTVTFVIDPVTGGKIVDGETTVYYVNPAKEVTVPQPKTQAKTGYEFEKWDQDTVTKAKKYTGDVTVKGNFKTLDDIIPSTDENGKSNAEPAGYITVTFEKGNNGKDITGQTVYYVNPNADKKLADITKKPTVTPETGYKADGWDKEDTQPITGDLTVTAKYKELDDVVPEKDDDGNNNTIPEGYIKVTFSTEENGKIKATTNTTKVVYVNPNKAVVLKGKEPTVTADTGYEFADWDTQITKKIQYSEGDTIKALYNEKDDVIPQVNDDGSTNNKPDGYYTVTFDKGEHGIRLEGKTVYYVKPNKKVTIPAPTVKANVGYEQGTGVDAWDKALTQTFTEDTKITAGYRALDDIIPEKNIDGIDRPDGYLTVTFKGENGTLVEPTIYYVKPGTEIDLTEKRFSEGLIKEDNADIGYTSNGGKWSKEGTTIPRTITIKNDETITYTFKELDYVIEKKSVNQKPPKGYVKVTLDPTDKATDKTKTVYFVNSTKEVTLTEVKKPTGKEIKDKNGNKYTYELDTWTSIRGVLGSWPLSNGPIKAKFTQDTDIEARYTKTEDLAPIAKENVITPVGVKPDAKDLIKNVYDENDQTNKGNLPKGTTFEYAEKPNVSEAGDITAKVKVIYPNGNKVIVEVPIKVVDNVIPQEGEEKPNNVPKDFVKVTFVPTDKGTMEGAKIFWVKPNENVKIPVKDPVGVGYNIFKEWKLGVNADGAVFKANKDTIFTEEETIITATYIDSDNIIPFDPKAENPKQRPDGYIRVTFDADLGLKLTESKAYYVKKNAGITIKQLTKPKYQEASGYKFDKWDKDDMFEIKEDIVVTALAKFTPSEPGYPEIIYRDKIVEKEKIVEKIVKVGENDELLKEIRYMQGYNGKFRPYDGLTRAEAAQILANALKADGYRYDANYALSYSDVGSKWYTDAVRVVTQAGVFQGYSDGTFRPQGKITRAEWVATLRRFQDLKEASGNTMMLRSNHWATAEVEAAYEAGWLGVYQNGIAKFDADKPITRQEVAYVSNRAFRRVLDKVYLKRSVNTLLTYKDINPSMPLYEDILCASNTLLTDNRYYKANTVVMDNLTFNIVTDYLRIQQKKFQYNVIR